MLLSLTRDALTPETLGTLFLYTDPHILRPGNALFCLSNAYELQIEMYLERLERVLSTERGLRLVFGSGDSQESLELSREAADQMLQALRVVTKQVAGEERLTLTVLGHQVVRTPEAYGLLIRTQEFGDVVFSLPQAVLQRLITDLTHLASSPPMLRTLDSGDATGHARGKIEPPYPLANRHR